MTGQRAVATLGAGGYAGVRDSEVELGGAGRSDLGSRRIRWCPRLGGGARRSGHVTQEWGKVMSDHVGRSKARDT